MLIFSFLNTTSWGGYPRPCFFVLITTSCRESTPIVFVLTSEYNERECQTAQYNERESPIAEYNEKKCLTAGYNGRECLIAVYNERDCLTAEYNDMECHIAQHIERETLGTVWFLGDWTLRLCPVSNHRETSVYTMWNHRYSRLCLMATHRETKV